MKRLIFVVLFCMTALFVDAHAQTQPPPPPHGVELSWTYSDPSIPTITFDVFRLNAACPASGTSGFTKITTTPIATQSYFDAAPAAVGTTLCYYLVANGDGLTSAPSPTSQLVYLPPPDTPPAPSTTVK